MYAPPLAANFTRTIVRGPQALCASNAVRFGASQATFATPNQRAASFTQSNVEDGGFVSSRGRDAAGSNPDLDHGHITVN